MVTGNVNSLAGGEAYSSEFEGTITSVEAFAPENKPESQRLRVTLEDDSTHVIMLFLLYQSEATRHLFEVSEGSYSFDEEQLNNWEAQRVRVDKNDKGYWNTTLTMNAPQPPAKPAPKAKGKK